MQKLLNTVAFTVVAVSLSTPASASVLGGILGGLFGGGGGGRGAPGPEAAVGLPFLAAAGAYALIRRRRAAKKAQ